MNNESTVNSATSNATTAEATPEVVKESITESGRDPEAAANEEAVVEKRAMEKELLSEVKPETSVGEPAPKIVDSSAPMTTAKDVPEIVKESITESHRDPEAAANAQVVSEKKAFEKELLSEVKPETSSGEPAPTITESAKDVSTPETTTSPSAVEPASAAIPKTDKLATPVSPAPDSRDVSPGTVPGTHSQSKPTVTSGVGTATTDATTEAAPATPAKAKPAESAPTTPSSSKAADSPAAPSTTDKKNKRKSFFGRIKEKLKN